MIAQWACIIHSKRVIKCLNCIFSAPRRPERSSIRRHKSSTTINNSISDNNNEQQQCFLRRWSFRLPQTINNANNTNNTSTISGSGNSSSKLGASQSAFIGSKQIAPPPPSAKETQEASLSSSPSLISSSSLSHLPPSSWGGPLKIPDYFRGIHGDRAVTGDLDDDSVRKTDAGKLKRFVSHTDLSQVSGPGSGLGSLLRTPSSSTSSIPAKVSLMSSWCHHN